MKRAVAFSFLLACCGVLLAGSSNAGSSRKPALLEDLVRLTKAGTSDVMVLAYARAHRLELPPEVSDEDLRWLRNSGVSEMVVRYMTAVDLRDSGEGAPKDAASGPYEDPVHPRAAYSRSEIDYDSYRGSYQDGYAGSYTDSYYDAYSSGYDYDYFPSYGYGYYPYPIYFFVDQRGFIHRFHGRDNRFGGLRGFDEGRGFEGPRGGFGPGGSRDSWRGRGFSGRRGSSIVVGPRGSGRPGFARGFGAGPQGPHGRVIGPRGFRPPGTARSSFPSGFRGPRGGVSGRGGFSHPSFSGSPHTDGGFSRSPRVAAGPPGGRGRR